ncbi:hypothetical protein ACIBG4_01635 [Nonomuraea sp. NPDC050383]|uniref:hypothetical protein n=1 Tax=Nonomuraea sp. NPDC050383 TaxID=3364362 RepID=UPI0037A12B74
MRTNSDMNILWANVEGFLMGTGELFAISATLPLVIASVLWLRKHRRYLATRTAQASFMILGVFMIFRSTYIALKYGGVHSVLDIQVKAGIGLIAGSFTCVAMELLYRYRGATAPVAHDDSAADAK